MARHLVAHRRGERLSRRRCTGTPECLVEPALGHGAPRHRALPRLLRQRAGTARRRARAARWLAAQGYAGLSGHYAWAMKEVPELLVIPDKNQLTAIIFG